MTYIYEIYPLIKVETVWFHCALLWLLADPFNNSSPSPSYCNPIPWKPIHIPPPEKPKEGSCGRKPQRRQRCNQSPGTAVRLRTSASPGQFQRRWNSSRLTPVFVMKLLWLTELNSSEWQKDFCFVFVADLLKSLFFLMIFEMCFWLIHV